MKDIEILDCTLRDGGYYTQWDFDAELVKKYISAMQELPVDIIEIGYRSLPQKEYFGKFFYLPDFAIEQIAAMNKTRKLAIMLNEKDTGIKDLDQLLKGLENRISLIRIAVNPEELVNTVGLAEEIRKSGFEVSLNMMYMSKYHQDNVFLRNLERLNGIATHVTLVDSYGGMYPNQVSELIAKAKKYCTGKIGFHSHDNLELSFANTLSAIEAGCDITDATIMGMGRGAGNLKTELLLTYLVAERKLDFDFNVLAGLVETWSHLHRKYEWGTQLPYMVSGANSLPQKDVMEWVTQRFYSFNSIIRALNNRKAGDHDNVKLPVFVSEKKYSNVVIIGGGPNAVLHADAVKRFVDQLDNVCIVHASSKNAKHYETLGIEQFFCLVGSEGRRMEDVFNDLDHFQGKCILPPFPRKMGTYIPEKVKDQSCELKEVTFTDRHQDSHTALALQTALELHAENVYLAGYDGYSDEMITPKEQGLISENEYAFERIGKHVNLVSILPGNYSLKTVSVYSLLL